MLHELAGEPAEAVGVLAVGVIGKRHAVEAPFS